MQQSYPSETKAIVTQEHGPPVMGCAIAAHLGGLPTDAEGFPAPELIERLTAAARRFTVTNVDFDGRDRMYLVLSDVDPRDALATSEVLRMALQSAARKAGAEITVAIGLSSFPFYAPSVGLASLTAEAAMCWVKAQGGDRSAHWSQLTNAVPSTAGDAAPDIVEALVAALEWKTKSDSGQTARSAWYAMRVADALQLSPADKRIIEQAALLHDIGKLGIPDWILSKPGRLTEEEFVTVRQHPIIGYEILGTVPDLAPVAQIIAHHHEHFDGSGYPDGLSGDQIPLGARIIMLADAFDAMTTARAYRSILSFQAASQEIEATAGHQFDPAVARVFVQVVQKQGPQAIRWSMSAGAPRSTRPSLDLHRA